MDRLRRGNGRDLVDIGRYLRYAGSQARLCVAEPTGGAFARGWRTGDRGARATAPTWIEGIGRREVEPCFAFELVDRVVEVDDARSIGACMLLERFGGGRYGGSSGTNVAAAIDIARGMQARGESGSIVLLLCDRGDRYADTLFSDVWQAARGLDPRAAMRALAQATGQGIVVHGTS
jgi:cysteine synthase A